MGTQLQIQKQTAKPKRGVVVDLFRFKLTHQNTPKTTNNNNKELTLSPPSLSPSHTPSRRLSRSNCQSIRAKKKGTQAKQAKKGNLQLIFSSFRSRPLLPHGLSS